MFLFGFHEQKNVLRKQRSWKRQLAAKKSRRKEEKQRRRINRAQEPSKNTENLKKETNWENWESNCSDSTNILFYTFVLFFLFLQRSSHRPSSVDQTNPEGDHKRAFGRGSDHRTQTVCWPQYDRLHVRQGGWQGSDLTAVLKSRHNKNSGFDFDVPWNWK